MMHMLEYSSDFESCFCDHILSGMTDKQKQEMVDFCNDFFPMNNQLKKIEELILMKFDTIRHVINNMDKIKQENACKKHTTITKKGKEKHDFKEKIIKEFYGRYDSHIVREKNSIKMNTMLVEASGVLVCPYCNRNYINVRDNRMGGQLDHFYNKSIYPFLAVSLYNLVPSCSVCNLIKKENHFNISPFESITSNNEVKFEYLFISKTKISLLIKTNSKERELDISNLHLKEAYNIHDVDVLRMLDNEKKYNKDYRAKLKEVLKIDDLEIDKIIFGEIVEVENLINVPLGKLKSDIYENIKTARNISVV